MNKLIDWEIRSQDYVHNQLKIEIGITSTTLGANNLILLFSRLLQW